jgi:hypothetical protein
LGLMARPILIFLALFLLGGCAHRIISYSIHHEPVSLPDVPKDIVGTFNKSCPKAKIVSIWRTLGGETGAQLMYWVFRFEQDGKLREALIYGRADIAPFIYDVQN